MKKIELFKTQRLLAARIQMPRILAGDEYVQLAAYYREQMKHALPETAHLDVQLVPVYDAIRWQRSRASRRCSGSCWAWKISTSF